MTYTNWKINYKKQNIPDFIYEANFNELLTLTLANKGFESKSQFADFINCVDTFYDPFLLKGMNLAVDRINKAVITNEKVAVYGDYDVDGITSTCLLTQYLSSLGLDMLPYIPDRIDEGYGLNTSAIDYFKSVGISLIITVDCGITAIEETKYAATLGIDVIITDHHECQEILPEHVIAIVDPRQSDCSYPNKELAGVGVAMKLACAVDGSSEKIICDYIDLVAVGTVADVMPLTAENRYLIKLGLDKIQSDPSVGIKALLSKCNASDNKIVASTIGFTLAPRINAAGRLGKIQTAYDLLTTDNWNCALSLATDLCSLNKERQSIETSIWNEAIDILDKEELSSPIVLSSKEWHPGVVGIAASRLAEKYSLPVITICVKNGIGKGSCRSYGNFNIFDALSYCSDYLEVYGGHELAAGLTIKEENISSFRAALSEYYHNNIGAVENELICDIMISDPHMLSIENIESLLLLEPHGNGNPVPVFCITNAQLISIIPIGGGKHLRLKIAYNGNIFDCVYFSCSKEQLGSGLNDFIDIAFNCKINEYNGYKSVQLFVVSIRPHDSRELCRLILEDIESVLWCCSPYYPSRADFVKAWTALKKTSFVLGNELIDILDICPKEISREKFCICLKVWLELGLLNKGKNGSIYGATLNRSVSKVDLTKSDILNHLERS